MSNGIKDLTSRADTALDKATDYSDSLAALAVALNPGTSAGQDVFDIGLGGINILRSLLKGEGVPKKELARSGFGILGLLPFISGAATRRGRQALADLYNPIERGTGGGRSRAEFPEKFDKPDPYRPDVTGKNPLSEHDYEHWGYPKTKIEEPEPLTPQLRKVADESEDLGLGPRETSFGEELEGGSSYFGQRQLDRMRNAEARVIEEAERLRTKELEAIDLSTDPDMGPVRRVTVEAGEQKTLPGFIKPFRTKGYRSINRRIGQQLLPNGNFVERLRANKNLTAEEKIKIFNEEADYILKNYGEKYHKIFTEGFVHKPTRGGHTRADIIFEAMHGQKLIPSEYDAFMKEASTITQSGKSLSPLQRRLIRQKREAVAEKAGVEYQPVQRKKISRDQERLERRERLEREIKYKREGLPLNFMEKKPEASYETISSILTILEDVTPLGIKRAEGVGEFSPGLVKSVRKGLSELYEELGFNLPTPKRDVVPFEEFLERFQKLPSSEQIKYLSKYLKQTGETRTKEELLRVSARKYKRKDPMEGKIDLEREERIANRIALRQNINRALQDNHGDIGGAAKSLGMSPKELEGHMNRIRLSDTITRTRKP